MIVYGDAVRVEPRDRALEQARGEIDLAIGSPGSLEPVRRALLHLGEIEQALADAPCGSGWVHEASCAAARVAADAAADAFERVSRAPASGNPCDALRAREDLGRARRALALVSPSGDPLLVRVPEGFAFYGLLPDSYREAAIRWADEHEGAPGRGVLVLGVRSIGTALSAVVAAALRARGLGARRATVRPAGHPFARRVEGRFPPASHAIVVDEGPGLSGSSMLAAADMLRRSGIESVDLVPAHGSGPGAAASAEARRRWRALRSYPADEGAAPSARGLASALWSGIEALRGDEPERCEDLGGGAWRARQYDDPARWPAAPRALERPKLLVTGRSGRRVLFKFSGLATAPRGRGSMADAMARRLAGLARSGWTPAPLGVTAGFLAGEWVEGVPCSAASASRETFAHLAAYLAASARGPLAPREAEHARERLLDMVRVNAREGLGSGAAHAALEIVEASGAPPGDLPGAGDGRMAPHEWIRTPGGGLVKTDAGGHELDHTWVGRQPIVWDLAGTALEWDLRGDAEAAFLLDFEARSGLRTRECLPGYLVAYAAHRMGQSRFFAEAERDPRERGIQERAFERWRLTLLRILSAGAERRRVA